MKAMNYCEDELYSINFNTHLGLVDKQSLINAALAHDACDEINLNALLDEILDAADLCGIDNIKNQGGFYFEVRAINRKLRDTATVWVDLEARSASEIAKQDFKLKNLSVIMDETNVPRSTLNDWAHDKPKLFNAVCTGVKTINESRK
jgi:hypothetical protein